MGSLIHYNLQAQWTWSENRQPRATNRTPTVKPAFRSSSGREKKKERSEEKDIRVQAAHGNVSNCLDWNWGRHPTRKARHGREKQGILKPKTRSKKDRWIKEKEGDGCRRSEGSRGEFWNLPSFFLYRLTGHDTKLLKLRFLFFKFTKLPRYMSQCGYPSSRDSTSGW